MLTVSISFLACRYTAADFNNPDIPEWPPHPGRLFMAMAAAYFEGGMDRDEGAAMEWLECRDPPIILCNDAETARRSEAHAFVPINDRNSIDNSQAPLSTLDVRIGRMRKERTFPTTVTGHRPVYLLWPDLECGKHASPLASIVSRVHRLGHSSSFVHVTVSESDEGSGDAVVPDRCGDTVIRWASRGLLARLEAAYKGDKNDNPSTQYHLRKARLNLISLQQHRYSREEDTHDIDFIAKQRGQFSSMRIMEIVAGRKPSISDTRKVVRAVKSNLFGDSPPTFVSGLNADKTPTTSPHLSVAPLPFVGGRHADGQIKGVALLLPRDRAPCDDDLVSNALRLGSGSSVGDVHIKGGHFGSFTLSLRTRNLVTLDHTTWAKPSRTWVSVTPIVLDRIPRKKRGRICTDAFDEIVAKSCDLQGLPTPVAHTSNTAFISGVPNATEFPPYAKGRLQSHALLVFDKTVEGPIIIGAGRYNGYGLCKPWWDDQWVA